MLRTALILEPPDPQATSLIIKKINNTINRYIYARLKKRVKLLGDGTDIYVMDKINIHNNLAENIFLYPKISESKTKALIWSIIENFNKFSKEINLRFRDIDFFDVIKHHLINEYFLIVSKTEEMLNIVNKYDVIYVQNKTYGFGLIISNICRTTDKKCVSLDSDILGKVKAKIRLKLARNQYFNEELCVDNLSLFVIGPTPQILVSSRYINILRAIKPVVYEMMNRGYGSYILGPKNDVKNIFPGSFELRLPKYKTKYKLEPLRSRLNPILGNDYKHLFTYRGINLWSLFKNHLTYPLTDALKHLEKNLNFFYNIVTITKPRMLIVGDDRITPGRLHALICKKKGIKSIEIAHGAYFYQSPQNSPCVDTVFVGGSLFKNFFLFIGTNKNKIEVTGWPKYDSISQDDVKFEKSILYVPTPLDQNFNLTVAGKLEEIGKDIGYNVMIKPHPGENQNVYKLFRDSRNVEVCNKNDDVLKLLEKTSLVVTQSSTVGIEAVIFGKPLIVVDQIKEYNIGDYYINSGVAFGAKVEELSNVIKRVLFTNNIKLKLPENRLKFIREVLYKIDGRATQRICNKIETMLR